MDNVLEKYLNTIDHHLKPISISERTDIINEIKSQMLEMQTTEGLSSDEIVKYLGNPKDMAKAYLGDLISKSASVHHHKFLPLLAFYGTTGLSGIFVIPFLGIMAPVLKLCAFVVPAAGLIKLIGYLFHFNVSFIMIGFGSYELNPILSFLISLLVGFGMYKGSNALWNLLMNYIHGVSKRKDALFNR